MRVLSWNLYHGRDFPPDPALFTLRSRLLRVTERERHPRPGQPAAPRRVRRLARRIASGTWRCSRRRRRSGSAARRARRARTACACSPRATWCPRLQRLAGRPQPRPDRLREGGSNQLLVRAPGRILEHRQVHAHLPARAAPDDLGARRSCRAADRMRGEPARVGGTTREGRRPRWWPPPRARSSGRAATRSCSAATQPAPGAHAGAVRGAARAVRPRRPDRPGARSTTCSRAGSRWSSGRGGCAPEERELTADGRASAPAVRPRARRRALRGIVRHGVEALTTRVKRGNETWRSVEAAEVRRQAKSGGSARKSSSGESSRSKSTVVGKPVGREQSRPRQSRSRSRRAGPSGSSRSRRKPLVEREVVVSRSRRPRSAPRPPRRAARRAGASRRRARPRRPPRAPPRAARAAPASRPRPSPSSARRCART